jgi:hypothetical protein
MECVSAWKPADVSVAHISGDRATILTPCGNTFRGSDMLYSGRLPLTYPSGTAFSPIFDLSHSASRNEIALHSGDL